MNKNVKSIFFVATLITMLLAVSVVTASDVSDDTPITDAVEDYVVNDVSQVATDDNVVTKEVQSTVSDNNVETSTKNMKSDEKNLKTETKTVNVNTLDELVNTLINAGIDTENEEYIINLNEGTYTTQFAFDGYTNTSSKPNIIINANNQTLSGMMIMFSNGCNITLNDATLEFSIYTGLSGSNTLIDTFNNVHLNTQVSVNQLTLILSNCTVNNTLVNNGKIIINDDVIFEDNFSISGNGEFVINNTNIIYPYTNTFKGKSTLTNMTIDKDITNNGDMSLKNVTINKTITNNGKLIISDDTVFGDNCNIINNGEIQINDTNRIAIYLPNYNGNYTLTNTTINSDKKNYANLTIINSTINSKIINNLKGCLTLINSTIDGEIINYGAVIVDNVSNIDNIINYGDIFEGSLPEDYSFEHTSYIVTNDTIDVIFDGNNGCKLSDLVKEGNTLDFRGTISHVTGLSSLVIDKPVNIITSTGDGRIESFSSINYNNCSSGSNITGLYTYNTQFYVSNAHNMVFDNISNVVNSSRIGWGVGQSSIRENSTNITLKNSYFYTKDNGGSSTLVFAWADNSTIENCTVVGVGNVGNLVYLTTYNVNIEGVIANSNNKIINNTIIGPSKAQIICYALAMSGVNNIIDGNIINYTGAGITGQWGSGVTGNINEEQSLIDIYNNTICNNKLYGCGIGGGNIIYDNYVEGSITANNARVYNNTANGLTISDNATVTNNIINGTTTVQSTTRNYAIIENNTLSNIQISGDKAIFNNNNITGTITIAGSNNNITCNTVINDDTYTMTGNGKNNIIMDNYLRASEKYGDGSVNLNNENNVIENNTPRYELIINTTEFTAGQNATITASIYFDGKLVNTINKGKVTFKVNSKALKDANGKVIYAKVVNGTATIENYTIPTSWTKNNTTIQAVYSGSTQCEKLTSEKTNITVQKTVPTFTTSNLTATIASTINLTATITDGDNVINTGKVVFKINGKTIKDTNGKVIYAKVQNNTVSVEYTLPSDMKAKEYNITAVFTSTVYDKLEDVKTLSVTA